MFSTIVHHTLQDKENPDYVEGNGPFAVENIRDAYLGEGYYFWDDHLDLAHWWGEYHCQNNYIICQAEFMIQKSDFCDLVGSRQDQIYFKKCIEELSVHHLPIGAIIGILRKLESRPDKKGVFPYNAVRAVEIQKNSFLQPLFKFSSKRSGITTLNPKIIICLLKKGEEFLKSFKIIFPNKYIN